MGIMNSFRGKLGLRLVDTHETFHASSSPNSDFHVEVSIDGSLSEDSSIDSLSFFYGPKKRADTAETETSFQPTVSKDSIKDDNDIILEGIGSYDEDECVIWYPDRSFSLSEDEDDNVGQCNDTSKQQPTLTPLDTDSVFAEAETMLAFHKKPTFDPPGYSVIKPTKRKKKVRNNGFNANTNKSKKARGFLARSRKFFSLSKVPASIAEEPCSTPSSTSPSAPTSPY